MEQEKKIRREIANSNERRRMQSINAGFNSLRTMLPKHDGEKLSKAAILQHTAEYIDQLEQHKTRLLQEVRDMKQLLNPELLALHQKNLAETEKETAQQPAFKRIKLEVNSSLDLSNSDSSDEGIQCNASPKNDAFNGYTNLNNVNKSNCLQIVNEVNTLNTNNNNSQLINNLKQEDKLLVCASSKCENTSPDELRAELVEVRKVLDRERKLRMKLEQQVRALQAQLYPSRIKEIAHQVQMQFQSLEVQNQFSNDLETSNAVSAVMVNDDHEVVAETIEIETHNCLESPTAASLLASTQQPILTSPKHYSQLNNETNGGILTSNVNNSNTVHLIHDSMLIDTTIYSEDNLNKYPEDLSSKITTTSTGNITTNNSSNKYGKPKINLTSCSNQQKNKNNQPQNKQNLTVLNTSSLSSQTTSSINVPKNQCTTDNTLAASNLAFNNKKIANVALISVNSDKNKKIKTSTPAAIALPIDAPFIYETGVNTTNKQNLIEQNIIPTTLTLQIIGANMVDSYESTNTGSNNAGRNLDTIVEAIRHLEGDHLFGEIGSVNRDQPQHLIIENTINKDSNLPNSSKLINKQQNEKSDLFDRTLITISQDSTNKQNLDIFKTNKNTNDQTRTILTVSPEQIGAIRQKVIKCVSNTSRPGVIVSTNP